VLNVVLPVVRERDRMKWKTVGRKKGLIFVTSKSEVNDFEKNE
jgi:hypothetical protein